MTKYEFAAKLNEKIDIEALIAEIANAENDEAVQEILKQNGVELTAEEMMQMIASEDELDETALEDVAGGCKCKGLLKRLGTKFLQWVFKTATGNKPKCPECGD